MKKCYFLCLFMLLSGWANAQNKEIVEAKSGEKLDDKISTHMQYLLPEFTDGYVFLKGMPQSPEKLNYNMLHGEMHFINPENMVLAVGNISDVIMITIAGRKFFPYNNSEFVEELLATNKMQLQVRRKGNIASYSKKGAYGTNSSTSSITSINSFDDSNRTYNIDVTENVMVSLHNFYYLVVKGKRIQIKNQKTFTKQFPKHVTQIETFVKKQNIRFDNEENLKELVNYCSVKLN